jgi:glycerol-3-phosphate cytidylyltransferase
MQTVITFGTFDLFHIGHLNILKRARALGDRVVVGISSDELNFSKKGTFPTYPLQDRLQIVEAVSYVDQVFVEHSLEEKRSYILEHGGNVLVMGDDWAGKFDHFGDICEVVYLPRTEGVSSTEIKTLIKFDKILGVTP